MLPTNTKSEDLGGNREILHESNTKNKKKKIRLFQANLRDRPALRFYRTWKDNMQAHRCGLRSLDGENKSQDITLFGRETSLI